MRHSLFSITEQEVTFTINGNPNFSYDALVREMRKHKMPAGNDDVVDTYTVQDYINDGYPPAIELTHQQLVDLLLPFLEKIKSVDNRSVST